MNLNLVRSLLDGFLEDNNLYLYDLKERKENNNLILTVLVGKKKSDITIDELVMVNEYLSTKLDEFDQELPPYYLEVSSPGAERDIRSLEELEEAVGKYIYVEQNGMKYVGDLIDLKEDMLTLRVNLKGRYKNFVFKYSEINKIHYQVKF